MVVDTHPSTHPPLPPTTEDARLSWLRLLRSRRVGPSTFWRMLSEHGSAEAALAALPGVARAAGLDRYSPCPLEIAQTELARGRALGAQLLARGEAAYPRALEDLADPPPLLWALGRVELLSTPGVAMVGARTASSLGLRMARSLAVDLGRAGQVVISGLARGIDTAAHEAALDTGTVAVMAGGVDQIYPPENRALAEDIARTGLRISEQPIGVTPTARHFPLRNRLISGLSRAVIVVEAAAKSGTLITARHALDQGRDVLAVPGHPFDPRASGCNMLLRDGAVLVRGARDVLEALDLPDQAEARTTAPSRPPVPLDAPSPGKVRGRSPLRDVARLHQMILDRLGAAPLAEDALIRDIDAAPHLVSPALTDLELEGRIERQPGGLISRAS
ncbi:DNA-processing protein DprA [Oceanicola sp. S124]|uniref:DNA-processing protein DprA n=1 Tax=Oceanicola sp. S124 TaxID=1042378 RepID=UPI00110F741A|nr:DNA-processing protein DprA [Oceanicola sp. S124]